MIESFVITLREGVEAALVVCVALAYLRKAGRSDLAKPVWGGVLSAAVICVVTAIVVKQKKIATEGKIEGIVLLVSAAMVTWLVLWMIRHGKRMKQETEAKLGTLVGGSSFGLFLFTFLMVFREGAETVLMLLAAGFTTEGILSSAGAALGLAIAIALGVAFYKGTIRVDLRKFFAITTVILLLFAFQLLASGLHEFAEADIIPSGERYMRVVGPLMKHSALFVIAILVLPFALLLRKAVAAEPAPLNPAEERKVRAQSRGERIAKATFATLAIAAVVTIGVSYAHETRLELTPPERIFDGDGEIRVPLADVSDGKLHRFAAKVKGKLLRFIVIRKDKEKDDYAMAMDACTICNDKGYGQIGERIVCINCLAEINPESIGESGGCNPIPFAFTRVQDTLVAAVKDLEVHASYFKSGARFLVKCPGCQMEFDVEEAGGRGPDGRYYCRMPGCAPDRRPK
jgi:FTR1 family protein